LDNLTIVSTIFVCLFLYQSKGIDYLTATIYCVIIGLR